jgi:hypothetical protein
VEGKFLSVFLSLQSLSTTASLVASWPITREGQSHLPKGEGTEHQEHNHQPLLSVWEAYFLVIFSFAKNTRLSTRYVFPMFQKADFGEECGWRRIS